MSSESFTPLTPQQVEKLTDRQFEIYRLSLEADLQRHWKDWDYNVNGHCVWRWHDCYIRFV